MKFAGELSKSKAPVIVAAKARVECLALAYGVGTARKMIIRAHNRAADEVERAKCHLGLRLLDELQA